LLNATNDVFETNTDSNPFVGRSGDDYLPTEKEGEMGLSLIYYGGSSYSNLISNKLNSGNPGAFVVEIGKHITDEHYPVGYQSKESNFVALQILGEIDVD
jgi:hypothetical protein